MGRLQCETFSASPRRLAKNVSVGESNIDAEIVAKESALQSVQLNALFQSARALDALAQIAVREVRKWL